MAGTRVWWDISRVDLRQRIERVRAHAVLAAQSGVAAGLAWFVAHNLLDHPAPFFAPISAVVVLAVSIGQRLRRALEMVVGVALGIAIGDALIYVIGVGAVQIAAVVILAILAAVFFGGGGVTVGQAASSAVLVATLAPPSTGIYYGRFVDALVGGVTGIVVMALLLPVNPLTVVRRAVDPAMVVLIDGLRLAAQALHQRDSEVALGALTRLRDGELRLAHLRDSLRVARETVTLAPTRWHARVALTQYLVAVEQLERALRNARVLARRVRSLLNEEEAVPPQLPDAATSLADGAEKLRGELAAGDAPSDCPDLRRGWSTARRSA